MKRIAKTLMAIVLLATTAITAVAQNGFNYQAVIRDASNNLVANRQISLRITLTDGANDIYYQETQKVTTNAYGVMAAVVGNGTPTIGAFNNVDWSKGNIVMKTEFDVAGGSNYADLGTTRLQSVPLANYAQSAGKVEKTNNIEIQADAETADDEAIFSVKDDEGNVVFAVYKSGVRVYVDDSETGSKAAKSGFAVAGRSASKTGENANYFAVDENGTQVFVDDTEGGKAAKSKFAVAGRSSSKDNANNKYFTIDDEGTQVFIDDEDGSKAAKSKFAVAGRSSSKDAETNYFLINSDSTRVYIDDEDGSKAAKSGFAVAGRSASKGANADILKVTKDSTRVYVDGGGSKSGFGVEGKGGDNSKSGFAVAEKGASGNAGYMNVTAQNFFAGYNAGKKTKSSGNGLGAFNTFIGNNVATATINSSDNVVLGTNAAQSAGTMHRSIIIGKDAGVGTSESLTTDDVFIGTRAGYSNVNGFYNVFIGNEAGYRNTSGEKNIFLGQQSGYYNTEGKNNVFLGTFAGQLHKTGDNNVALGSGAAQCADGMQNSVVIGTDAGIISSGINNVFMGTNAGHNTKVVTDYESWEWNNGAIEKVRRVDGSYNVFIGNDAGKGNTSGANNVFIGEKAGYLNSRSVNNIFIGKDAGFNTTNGTEDVEWYIPGGNGWTNVSRGSLNMFIGTKSGFSNTTGSKNTFLGHMAGYKTTTGKNNVFIGYSAGGYNTTGNNNIIVGKDAIYATGDGNILIGGQGATQTALNGGNANGATDHLSSNSFAIGNLLAGEISAGGDYFQGGGGKLLVNGTIRSSHIYPLKTGYNYNIGSTTDYWNTIYVQKIVNPNGSLSAQNLIPETTTTYNLGGSSRRWNYVYTQHINASGNIKALGYISSTSLEVSSSSSTANNKAIEVSSSGGTSSNYGVYSTATSSGTTNYGIYGYAYNGTNNYGIYGYASGGTTSYGVYSRGQAGGTSTWTSSSDARLKKDVKTLTGALDKVLKLRGVSYYWKNCEEMAAAKGVPADSLDYGYDDQKHIGVIAQELEAEYPELVHTDGDGFKSVEYSTFTPILIEAVKELKAEKDELQATIANQQQQIDELKRMVEELMKR